MAITAEMGSVRPQLHTSRGLILLFFFFFPSFFPVLWWNTTRMWCLILALHFYSIVSMWFNSFEIVITIVYNSLNVAFFPPLHTQTHTHTHTHTHNTISCQSSSNGCIISGKPQMSSGTRAGQRWLNFISKQVCVHGGGAHAFKQILNTNSQTRLLTVNGRLHCSITNTPPQTLREDWKNSNVDIQCY